ncbi:MAG: multidrug efflux RND transporter permease subunit [Verrucomicrobiota bacterium]
MGGDINKGFIAFFVERPIFASVIAFVIVIAGACSIVTLPISNYPDVVPPAISVTTQYIGGSAQVVADTVTEPIEEVVNGVEGMTYISSNSTNNGDSAITVTFEIGYDQSVAQMNVLNATNQALPELPADVQKYGVAVDKDSDNLLICVNLLSPNGTYDGVFLGNYADIHVYDALMRLEGVASITNFGFRKYAIRIWLDPHKLQNLGLTALDVADAVEEQNMQLPAGSMGSAPATKEQAFVYQLSAQGRLTQVEQFEAIILRANEDGSLVTLGDVGRVELGAESYGSRTLADGKATGNLGVFQLAGANALDLRNAIVAEMDKLSEHFPEDLTYEIVYDTTRFVKESIREVVFTLCVAILLVFLVVYIFVQSWRATLIPAITIPVALVGSFAIMHAFGFSINMLSLLGLVLAVGLVVDDAIVVVENVQRRLEEGGTNMKEIVMAAMAEVRGPIITTTLVLLSVFVPVAVMPGMTGRLYNQFALTVAFAVFLSAVNSLTLSPALCAILLKPKGDGEEEKKKKNVVFRAFNEGFEKLAVGYERSVRGLSKAWPLVLLFFVGLCVALVFMLIQRPKAFIPNEDQGYFMIAVELPDGATVNRTQEVVSQVVDEALKTKGIEHAISITGFNIIDSIDQENAGVIFPVLAPWSERKAKVLHVEELISTMGKKLASITDAEIIALNPPPIRGLSATGGFQGEVQDLNAQGSEQLASVAKAVMAKAEARPEIEDVTTTFQTGFPGRFLNIDRVKAKSMGVSISDIFDTLQINVGSYYVNAINKFGRVYWVYIQAEDEDRMTEEDISGLKVRNAAGEMIDLAAFIEFEPTMGPYNVTHYQLYPSVSLLGNPAEGYSSGQAVRAMEEVAGTMPNGYAFAWTGLIFQQVKAGNLAPVLFALSLVLTFLVLSAQYESWMMPIMVLFAVPLGLLGGLTGLALRGMPLDVYGQIGLLVLIGLAAKNAILIVEFAKDRRAIGEGIIESARIAARIRLRPILMTAFALIFGVLPLVFAPGAGANARQSLGTTVVSGMILATLLIIMVPVFYVVIQRMREHFGHGAPEEEVG